MVQAWAKRFSVYVVLYIAGCAPVVAIESIRVGMASTSSSKGTKRIKLLSLGGRSHVSTKAKHAILKDLQAQGYLPSTEAISSWAITKEKEELASTETPFLGR